MASAAEAQLPVAIPGAVQFDLASPVSGRTYRIFVYRPEAPPPAAGYPVLVVTDGNLTFPIAATMAAAFVRGGRPGMVVGVGYATEDDPAAPSRLRSRDLTPPTPMSRIKPAPGQPPPQPENYGGADDFRRFLVETLRPAIAAAFPVDPDRQTLFGHSLGGLFTLGVLFSHPASFRGFVASSPSIWWNRRGLLRGEAGFARKLAATVGAPRVLITIGDEEQALPPELPPGMSRAQAVKLLREARMVDNAAELAARLAGLAAAPRYAVRFQAFEAEDHLTVVAAAVSRALAFALRP